MSETTTPRPLGSRYELLDLLGTGAMGEVWRARDREGGGLLAAKLLRREFALDTEIVTRFIQERSILMSLRHPNIVRVHDLVVEGDRLGIVMDLIEGGDLRGRLRQRGTFSRREAVVATCRALDGLAEAHARGVLHRDVKPDNVLLAGDILTEETSVQLSDFSIARLAQESTVQATGLLGTPGYMPPELFEHGQFSAASDVYAAGVMLYELLGGRTPFAGAGTAHTVGFRHVHSEPPRLPVEDELWHVLATMLSKDPRTRLTAKGTAQALRDLPEHVLAGADLPVQQAPASWGPAQLTALRPGRIEVEEQSGDLGMTNINAAGPAPVELAGTGEVQALAPASVPDDDAMTSVGRPAPSHHAPELVKGAHAAEQKPRPRWLPWTIGAAALLLVGGVVAFVLLRGGDQPVGPTDEPTVDAANAVTGELAGDPLPSGLEVDRDATYDPGSQTVEVTVTWTADDAPLTGPFLEVVPPAVEGDQCPGVAWEGAAQPRTPVTSTGIPVGVCAYSVDAGTIRPGESFEATYTTEVDLGDDDGALDAWLERTGSQADAALDYASTRGSQFPVQMLSDVSVEIPPSITTATSSITVRLVPLWRNADEPDQLHEMFSSRTGQSTLLLDQVAGGLAGLRLTESCGGAISISPRNAVSVLRAQDGCIVQARVGNFEVESPSFDIRSLGG